MLTVPLACAVAFSASVNASSTKHNVGSAQATESSAAAHYSRAVCAEHPGRARCDSEVVTDASGRPLAFKHPTKNPNAASGTWNSYGISPAAFHKAYNLPWTSVSRQTIAVVDAYDHPNVKTDLDSFDSAWGLGSFPNCSSTQTTACFQRVDQNGNAQGFTNTNVSAVDLASWTLESNLDVQSAHGICLNCKILLVEAYADSPVNLAAAVDTAARLGATEISNSYGWAESALSTWKPASYNHTGIAITASAQDHGYGSYYPADLNTVVAVGGTKLNLNSDGSYNSESVWGNGVNSPNGHGTGSGCSTYASSYTSAPYWQKTVANWAYTGCVNRRSIADVAADADPTTGAWVYNSVPNSLGQTGWFAVGGTSLSAPIIAGVYALAGNAANWTWPAQSLYQNSNKLIDVRTGSNGTCSYTIMCNGWAGYDGPTGLGTPWGLGAF